MCIRDRLSIDAATLNSLSVSRLYCWPSIGCIRGENTHSLSTAEPPLVLLCVDRRRFEKELAENCINTLDMRGEGSAELSNPIVFLRVVSSLYSHGPSQEKAFTDLLARIIAMALPTCSVEKERYLSYNRSRVDLLIVCKELAVVVEVKTPEHLSGTPSRDVAHQVLEYLQDLGHTYPEKRRAVIVVRTDGGPIPYVYELRRYRYVHVLSRHTVDELERYCLEEGIHSVYELLRALAEARIDTIHVEEKALARS